MIQVVCVLTGDRIPNVYVDKLHSMLLRNSSEPLQLTCLTDRPRALNPEVVQKDISDWGLQGWFNKLRLLDPSALGLEEFLYLDLTLVLKADPSTLVRFAQETGKDLTLVRDWHYESFNTSVMWVRPSDFTAQIWRAFVSGAEHRGRLSTDQDYLTGFLRDTGQEAEVATFPEDMVQSYKQLLKLNRTHPAQARERAERATVIKFHGSPRPHEVLGLGYWLKRSAKYPKQARRDFRFLTDEIRRWWA